jgi:ubiquitin C-terminal hydrolase
MNGGHYTSAVLNNGSWYEYNDSVVEKITEAQVRS